MENTEVNHVFDTTDRRWAAVINRDSSADGAFVYAVRTTGIVCWPSCPSRKPNRKNVAFYDTVAEAVHRGYRLCKRCWSAGKRPEERVAHVITEACHVINANDTVPDLQSLAHSVGLSPHHFHRLFKSALGVTPVDFARMKRDVRLKLALRSEATITEAIYAAGFNANSRFYSQSEKALGMKPKAFRAGGEGEEIRFALGECSLGHVLVAATEVGVCSIALGDSEEVLLNELQDQFSAAVLVGDDNMFANHVAAVVGFVETPESPLNLPLDIRGTAFQRRVWNELQKTIPGETLTYMDVAKQLGLPNGARAVAKACGANAIALAIPCHRVVRLDGKSSGYRWGIDRKEELLTREQNAKRS